MTFTNDKVIKTGKKARLHGSSANLTSKIDRKFKINEILNGSVSHKDSTKIDLDCDSLKRDRSTSTNLSPMAEIQWDPTRGLRFENQELSIIRSNGSFKHFELGDQTKQPKACRRLLIPRSSPIYVEAIK